MTKKDAQKGFMLIEILVAVFIFTIVMIVSLTAVLALLDANRKNQSIKSVVNNLNLVITGVAKSMAVSKYFYCGEAPSGYASGYNGEDADCPDDPNSAITFTFNEDKNNNNSLDVIRYKFQNNQIVRSIDSTNPADYVPVTAPEVKITGMDFYVFNTVPLEIDLNTGSATGDESQPRVVMVINGYAGEKENIKTKFNIQTTVSQRDLDVVYSQ